MLNAVLEENGSNVPVTAGYFQIFIHRYANIECSAFHPFSAAAPGFLVWYPLHSDSRWGWTAIADERGGWRLLGWRAPLETDTAIDPASGMLTHISISVTVQGKGPEIISRTFVNPLRGIGKP